MKSIKTSLSILALITVGILPMQAQDAPTYVPKDVKVQFTNELESLAEGYVKAFKALPVGAKYLMVKTADGSEYLGSVRSMKAFDGVLLIEQERGIFTAISARDVLSISNKRPE